MAILPLRGFGCKMPIWAIFVEVFWGFDPLNVVRYCRYPQKAHPWPETHIDCPDRSRNVPGHVEKKAKKERPRSDGLKKEKKLRDLTSHVCAQITHVELPPPKLSCGVGSRT